MRIKKDPRRDFESARWRHRKTTGKQVKQMKAKTLPQKTIGNEDKEQQEHSHEWGTCEPRKIQGYECSIFQFKKVSWLIPRDLKCNICHAVSALTTSKWDHTGDSFGFWNIGLEAKQLPVKRLWHGFVCLHLTNKSQIQGGNFSSKCCHWIPWVWMAVVLWRDWIQVHLNLSCPNASATRIDFERWNGRLEQQMETTSWQTPRTPTFVDLRCIFDLCNITRAASWAEAKLSYDYHTKCTRAQRASLSVASSHPNFGTGFVTAS